MKPAPITDRYGLVYAILVVLGIGTLLPWNVFITEKEFFDIRLHVHPSSPLIANNYISLFGLVFNSANLLALCVVIAFQKHLSLRTQIVNPLVLILMVLASTAGLALQLDLSGTTVAYYSLPALAVLGMCMAVLQGGLLNLASLFPPIYIQGYVVGCGLSGCATSLLSFLAQLEASSGGDARTPADVAPAAALYFGAAAGITGACTLCFSLLTRLRYSRAKLGPYLASRAAAAAAEAAAAGDLDLLEALLPPGPGAPSGLPAGKDPDALPSYAQPRQQGRQLPSSSGARDFYHPPPLAPGGAGGGLARDFFVSQLAGARGEPGLREHAAADAAIAAPGPPAGARARGAGTFVAYALAILLTMCVSLAVWPGVTAFICSVHNPARVSPCAPSSSRAGWVGRLTGDLFVPITFVVFGVGDLCGRIASSWGPWGRRPPAAASLLAYALARLGIAAAILVCNVVTPRPWALPVLLHSDWAPLVLITLLGLTQGHLLSTACMHAPAVVPPGKEGEFGPITGFCITAGCLAGSASLFAIMQHMCSCQPRHVGSLVLQPRLLDAPCCWWWVVGAEAEWLSSCSQPRLVCSCACLACVPILRGA